MIRYAPVNYRSVRIPSLDDQIRHLKVTGELYDRSAPKMRQIGFVPDLPYAHAFIGGPPFKSCQFTIWPIPFHRSVDECRPSIVRIDTNCFSGVVSTCACSVQEDRSCKFARRRRCGRNRCTPTITA